MRLLCVRCVCAVEDRMGHVRQPRISFPGV